MRVDFINIIAQITSSILLIKTSWLLLSKRLRLLGLGARLHSLRLLLSQIVVLIEGFALLDDCLWQPTLELREDAGFHVVLCHLFRESLLEAIAGDVEDKLELLCGVIDPLFDPRHVVVQCALVRLR